MTDPWTFRPESAEVDRDLDDDNFDSGIPKKEGFYPGYPPEPPPGYPDIRTIGRTNDLEIILKPFLTYMRISGLFFDEEPGSTRGYTLPKLFCLFTVTVNWLVLLSYLVLFLILFLLMEKLNFDQLPIMICTMTWHLQNAINATVCYRLSSGGRFQDTFYNRWNAFQPSDAIRGEVATHTKKMRNFVLSISLFINIFNSFGWIFGTFDLIPGSSDFKIYPIDEVFGDNTHKIIHRTWGVAAAFTTPAWTLLLGMFCIVCSVLNVLYDTYNGQLKSSVEAMVASKSSLTVSKIMPARLTGDQFPHNIEMYRLQYEKVNKLVECADENFSFYLLTTVLTNMISLCSIVYHSIYFCSRGLVKALGIFWIVSSVANIGMVCYFGAWLNESAHEALPSLHNIPNENLPLKRLQQITMFINRLSGPLIGFTGWGFFILSKDLIMSLVSTFFTYFFLLVQFGNSNGNSTDCS